MLNENFMKVLKKKSLESAVHIADKFHEKIDTAIIFGTGLSYQTLKSAKILNEINYEEIPYFNKTAVKSHEGKIIMAEILNTKIMMMVGRNHYYEGHDLQEVVYPIHVLKELGVNNLIITSSVGGVNPNIKRGELVIIKDHINLTALNPLIGYDDSLGERFLDCSQIYCNDLSKKLEDSLRKRNPKIKKGVIFFLPGPTFETNAELKAFRRLGADTIGWSTVPEAIVAHYRKMNIAAINCVTDSLNYKKGSDLDEIIDVARNSSTELYHALFETFRNN
jgi:purine-nucleoside phosphorylase